MNIEWKKIIRQISLVLGFVVFLIFVSIISFKYFEKQTEIDVSNIKPEYFPIVVMKTGEVDTIDFNDIEREKINDPTISFLIPDGQEESVNQKLKKTFEKRSGGGIPEVRVKKISNGKQLIEFEISGDGFFLMRYEASDKTVKPLMRKLSGPGIIFILVQLRYLLGL